MLQIGIVDDEQIYREKHYDIVIEALKKYGFDAKVECYEKVIEVSQELDILFLDIELGKESGIQLARKFDSLKSKTIIVFVTSHDKYVMDSFGLNIYKYIR